MTFLQLILLISKFFLLVCLVGRPSKASEAPLVQGCSSDSDCESLYKSGSICLDGGQCSNPFTSGCLRAINPTGGHRKRICNADDGQHEDNCIRSLFDYPEIRVHQQDWEVSVFLSWIIQIYLMEVLEVPVRLGLGKDSPESSFYSIENNLQYSSKSYSFEAIRTANELGGNCQLTEKECAHIMPDVWLGQGQMVRKEYEAGQLDSIGGNGQVGKISWFVPKFTAARHDFALTYIGLANNREKVAQVFKRPTTWQDYCDQVSNTSCIDDEVADRYPQEHETGLYFTDGYRGHFRATSKNNCTGEANADSCSGHIVNAQCSWSTFVEAQAHWNSIELESDGPNLVNGGYSRDEMMQIWSAANATKSDVMMWWYEPSALFQQFLGTDAEFTKVSLPTPSIECRKARTHPDDRCSKDPFVRRGDKEGACDNKAQVMKKAIASSLRNNAIAEDETIESPGYWFIRNFNIDELEMSTMLQNFVKGRMTGAAAREAVCGWITNNLDYLEGFVPHGHPRTITSEPPRNTQSIIAMCLSGVAILNVLVISCLMYRQRNENEFKYAQIQFIYLVLFGLLLVAIGGFFFAVEPNQGICTTRVWLVSLGYTCELIPLIIKISALNHLMRASKRLKRVRIRPNALYAKVIFVNFLVVIYILVWTLLDPPRKVETLTKKTETTLTAQIGCQSSSGYWLTGYLFWEGLLVFAASVLAFQSRHAKSEFNESKSLAFMIYSHVVFCALRVAAVNVFQDDSQMQMLALSVSFCLSLDVITATTIYIIPKFVAVRRRKRAQKMGLTSTNFQGSDTVRQIQLAANSNPTVMQRIGQSMRNMFGSTHDDGSMIGKRDQSRKIADQGNECKRFESHVIKEAVESKEQEEKLNDSFGSLDRVQVNDSRVVLDGRKKDPNDSSSSRQLAPLSARQRSLVTSFAKGAKQSMRLIFAPAHELMPSNDQRISTLSESDEMAESQAQASSHRSAHDNVEESQSQASSHRSSHDNEEATLEA